MTRREGPSKPKKFRSRLLREATRQGLGARRPTSATRQLLCGAYHSPPMRVAEGHARMRPVSTGLPCPPSSKFQRGRQADSQREAPWRADAGPFASPAAAQWTPYPAAACRRSPCPRAPFWNLFALSSLSPKFQSRREQTFTCWEPGARGPPSATRLLLCGAHHATQQPVAEACALVPLFLWVMLLQRWTIFFAARGRRRLPGRHPWWSDSTLTAPSRSMCHRSLPRARSRCLSRCLSRASNVLVLKMRGLTKKPAGERRSEKDEAGQRGRGFVRRWRP